MRGGGAIGAQRQRPQNSSAEEPLEGPSDRVTLGHTCPEGIWQRYRFRCRIFDRLRRFLRPSLRRPFPDFLTPTTPPHVRNNKLKLAAAMTRGNPETGLRGPRAELLILVAARRLRQEVRDRDRGASAPCTRAESGVQARGAIRRLRQVWQSCEIVNQCSVGSTTSGIVPCGMNSTLRLVADTPCNGKIHSL